MSCGSEKFAGSVVAGKLVVVQWSSGDRASVRMSPAVTCKVRKLGLVKMPAFLAAVLAGMRAAVTKKEGPHT